MSAEVVLRFRGGPLDGHEQGYEGRAEDGWQGVTLIGIESMDGLIFGYRRSGFLLHVRGDGTVDGWAKFDYVKEIEVQPGGQVRVIRMVKEL